MAKGYSGDTSPNVGKYIMQIDPFVFKPILYNHISTSSYLLTDKKAGDIIKGSDVSFISNNNVWENIILDNIRHIDSKIILISFFLFEWFPRSPGLYHTPQGRDAREEAEGRKISTKDGLTVYDPYGKISMLDGGYGNIRLKPIRLDNGLYYFMTASDNGICHQGFPIALPEYFYTRTINEIRERGSVVKDLIGILKSVPEDIDNLYRGYKNVPKVYLEVEELRDPTYPKRVSTEEKVVTVACSFISNYEGWSKIYASYVGFDPSKKRELIENTEWMEQEYVRGMYKGRVLTDFDQITNHFDDAPFSLKKIMNLEVTTADISLLASAIGGSSNDILIIQNEIREHLASVNKLNAQSVFISYNHQDIEIARRIQQRLEAEGFKVIRDEDHSKTGQKIEEFIRQSIKQSSFTLSIISENSLESAWVSLETIYQHYAGMLTENRLLPVYTDSDFFEYSFRKDIINKAKKKARKLNADIKNSLDNGIGITDLSSEKERTDDLVHHLPKILDKLRNTICVDLGDTNFEKGISRIIKDIKSYSRE